jgi:hypothetical protein
MMEVAYSFLMQLGKKHLKTYLEKNKTSFRYHYVTHNWVDDSIHGVVDTKYLTRSALIGFK